MGELLQVQGNNDNRYLEILSEERDQLETSFESTLSTIDQLIELYSLNPEDEVSKKKFIELIRSLSTNPDKLSKSTTKIFRLEKEFQKLYKAQYKKLQDLNLSSFSKVSGSLETLYEQNLKNEEIQSLQKSVNLKSMELESSETVLNLDLSKSQLLELLNVEKEKRVNLTVLNEKLYEPTIKKLEQDFEKWNAREKDLNKFFTVDLEKVNKEIQSVKKTESLEF